MNVKFACVYCGKKKNLDYTTVGFLCNICIVRFKAS